MKNKLLRDNQPCPQRLSRGIAQRFHIDLPLLTGLIAVIVMGLFILYSADNQSWVLLSRQAIWVIGALVFMLVLAQISPRKYQQWTPWVFSIGITLLIAVLLVGHIGKGAQRWLNLGLFRFQPSEIMKIATPMMLGWYLDKRTLPPTLKDLLMCAIIIAIPTLLTAKQPDLGTAIVIASTGICVLLLAGIRWRVVGSVILLAAVSAPVLWHYLHDYQRERVLTFINPQRDPLGTGYHIIQSKIAIGSGGFFGKGWLHGTQSHLQFLPEHATDFIFAVVGEELGLLGSLILLSVFVLVVFRALYISNQAQDTFSRLLAGSLALTFFLSFFVNMGMVSGILPVVGVPLPLVSYGGTAMVTILAGFGIIMAIHTHRKLLAR